MTPPRHGALFLLVFVLLVAQFIFALKLEEPYPAIVFPAFGSAPKKGMPALPATRTYALELQGLDGTRREVDSAFLFGAMPPATAYRNLRRICPLPSDLAREHQSRQKHGHKPHYRFKLWLKDDLAGGYYKPGDEAVAQWIAQLKHAAQADVFRVVWQLDGEVDHVCAW